MVATKYLYQIVDKNNRIIKDVITETREDARMFKRELARTHGPCKIIQYEQRQVVR